MSNWQPIETAPKDGTCILVGNRYGTWVAKHMPVYPSGYRPSSPWFCMMLNREYMYVLGDLPTHWMPLPEPPK